MNSQQVGHCLTRQGGVSKEKLTKICQALDIQPEFVMPDIPATRRRSKEDMRLIRKGLSEDNNKVMSGETVGNDNGLKIVVELAENILTICNHSDLTRELVVEYCQAAVLKALKKIYS